jgi:hypothetical protein
VAESSDVPTIVSKFSRSTHRALSGKGVGVEAKVDVLQVNLHHTAGGTVNVGCSSSQ